MTDLGYFFFQAEDGIRDAEESRGVGDVYKGEECIRDLCRSGGGGFGCGGQLY